MTKKQDKEMNEKLEIEVEQHPLKPFLPKNTKVLFLGSFPPQQKRWCMNFFYPNFINDHWRLSGEVFFGNKNYFVDGVNKTFRLGEIKQFLQEKGIGYYDTATAVRRLKANASDKFLDIVIPTDIPRLTAGLRELKVIVTTGELATETICRMLQVNEMPKVGAWVEIESLKNRLLEDGTTTTASIALYRLPSSSRAYPLAFEKKAEAYRQMYLFAGLIAVH